MPVYAFVIVIILGSCYLLISEFEFGQVASEAIPALFLYSNFPSVHVTEYFDVVSSKPTPSPEQPLLEIKAPILLAHMASRSLNKLLYPLIRLGVCRLNFSFISSSLY